MKTRLIKYSVTAAIGLAIALLVMNGQGLFELYSSQKDVYSILSDSFFVPGILFVCVGALIWIASTGFFDSISYAVSVAAHAIIPFRKSVKKSYYDYKCERDEKRGGTPMFIFYTGAAFIAVALIFLALYYTAA